MTLVALSLGVSLALGATAAELPPTAASPEAPNELGPGRAPAVASPAASPAPAVHEDPAVFGRTPPPGGDREAEPESLAVVLVKMLLGLGVTVGAVYLTLAFLARRLTQLPGATGRVVRVAERVAIEPRRALYVLEAAGEYLLVGVGDGQMTVLSRLDADKARAALAAAPAAAGGRTPFWQRLIGWRKKPQDS